MEPSALDLFGEIPVTVDDLAAWCEAVAGIGPSSPRFAHYVRWYQVADKVRAAKLAGTFYAITESPDPRPRWWQALAPLYAPWSRQARA